ncbi:MAG: hypothetical protein WCR27_02635 [Eubacteriales bacterium]
MGTRAYLLVNVINEVDQDNFSNNLHELEEMPEVDFADPVVGTWDVVMMIEAPITIDAVAKKVQDLPWVKDVKTLKVVNTIERHKVSKEELLMEFAHQGV